MGKFTISSQQPILHEVTRFHTAAKFADYEEFVTQDQVKEFTDLMEGLHGRRIVHINATFTVGGGGVAEMLHTIVPFERSLGLQSSWYVIDGGPEVNEPFFNITKRIHNSLQGGESMLSNVEREFYRTVSKTVAKNLREIPADILFIHDPQPMGGIVFMQERPPMALRIHIDLTRPNLDTMAFVLPYMQQYNQLVFSMPEYVREEVDSNKVILMPPAIDPLAPKNKPMSLAVARGILQRLGIDSNRPLICQVSRFDPWKDPEGVVRAYWQAKKEFPKLQLMMLGICWANDDPEAVSVFQKVQRLVAQSPEGIFLLSEPEDLKGYSNDEVVNAAQTGSDVILQLSTREGFGMTCTEAMWKGTPVVAGNVGGLRLQIKDGVSGYLVNSPEEAAGRVKLLLQDSELRERMGAAGRQSVREKFLMPTMLATQLRLYRTMLTLK